MSEHPGRTRQLSCLQPHGLPINCIYVQKFENKAGIGQSKADFAMAHVCPGACARGRQHTGHPQLGTFTQVTHVIVFYGISYCLASSRLPCKRRSHQAARQRVGRFRFRAVFPSRASHFSAHKHSGFFILHNLHRRLWRCREYYDNSKKELSGNFVEMIGTKTTLFSLLRQVKGTITFPKT